MIWRDDAQRSAVARALLGMVRRQDLWTEHGPTDLACRYLEAGGGPLSSGEQVMLRLAFDMWNGQGRGTVDTLIYILDPRRLRIVGQLFVAGGTGAEAVDEWVALYQGGAQ